MVAVANLARGVLDGRLDAEAAVNDLAALSPTGRFANGFLSGDHGAAFHRGA